MYQADSEIVDESCHPVDLAESLAEEMGWDCWRDGDSELLIMYEGLWRHYRIAVSLMEASEILTVRCGFELKLEASDPAQLMQVMNIANQMCPVGSFTVHEPEEAVVFGCGHTLAGEAHLTADQVRMMLDVCISECERFYPAFQMVAYGSHGADSAMTAAIIEPLGAC